MPPRWFQALRAFEAQGCTLVDGKGSHVKIKRQGYRAYTFTLHKANPEMDLGYLRAACRQLGLDEARLMADLGIE